MITVAIRLRSDYDVSRAPASISTQAKMIMSIFRRSRISCIAVESNGYRNFDHFRRSRMRRGIVVSQSRRSRIATKTILRIAIVI